MFLKRLRNSRGFSLIEVLIASGLMALVATGMVSIVSTMNEEQNNQMRIATLRELKTRFQFLITDQNAWNATLNGSLNATNLLCVTSKQSCTPTASLTFPKDLTLYDASGTPFFTPPAHTLNAPSGWTGGQTYSGFTDKGERCNAFNGNTTGGNDACPISFRIVWDPICPPSPSTCKNPLMRVTVRLLYNPSPTKKMMALSMGATDTSGTNATTWYIDTTAGNTGKYDVVIKRSATTINKAFSLVIQSPAGGSAPFTAGAGGPCVSPAVRGANALKWTETDDAFDLATSDTSGNIVIKAGTYSCKLMGVAFGTNTFSIKLRRTNPTPAMDVAGSEGSGNAPGPPSWVQATATSSPIISITTDTTYNLIQTCSSDPGGTGTQFMMGVPTQPYSQQTIFASVTCTQTN